MINKFNNKIWFVFNYKVRILIRNSILTIWSSIRVYVVHSVRSSIQQQLEEDLSSEELKDVF